MSRSGSRSVPGIGEKGNAIERSECPECGAVFQTRRALWGHLQVHG